MSKSPFFDQDYGHIYFLDTLQGQIVVSSHRPICLDAKSPKLLNLVKEIFFRRPIMVINVKITIFWPRLWSYLFFGHPVWPNKAQQLEAYMSICKKSQIAPPCKGNIFQQAKNSFMAFKKFTSGAPFVKICQHLLMLVKIFKKILQCIW